MNLFAPIVDESEFHPNFRRLMETDAEPDREILLSWADGFKDRDGKFVREFQTTFNSGFWELYIFACCKALQLHVDFSFQSPDFVITNFHNEFCIEAVIASNALGEPPEWKREMKTPPDVEVVLDTAVIRLSNAIGSKNEKYSKLYSSLPQVKGRPFVLAVGPFEQPYFWAHNDHAIRQVLYGYDRVGSDGEHTFRKSIRKLSGNEIKLGIFTTSKFENISAVLFSNTATMSKVHALHHAFSDTTFFSALRFNHHGSQPFLQNAVKTDYEESLLDGLYLFHNPKALRPLSASYFKHPDICQGTLFGNNPVPKYVCKHGHLIQRSSMRIRPIPE